VHCPTNVFLTAARKAPARVLLFLRQQYILHNIIKNNYMTFDETLANRVREMIHETHTNTEEKRMFGGLCFMVNNKMCVGVESGRLMVRFDPSLTDQLMEKEGVHPMDFTTKVMKGYAFVDIGVLRTKKQLAYWLGLALAYNAIAKTSPKKKK
jgi:TfoX/Sxy family transcriptional regulator of competence genes